MRSSIQFPAGCFFVLLIPFLLLGFIFAEDALARGLKSRRIGKEWTPIPATVVSKSVVEVLEQRKEHTSTYRPAVVYEYVIPPNTYRCDHVDCLWSSSSSNRTDSEEVLARYYPGQTLTAYLNPADPRDAVLDPSPRISWVGLVFGVAFGSMALLFGFAFVAATRGDFRFEALRDGMTEARPLFGTKLILPSVLLVCWAGLATIGFVCVGIAASTPRAVWIFVLSHAAVGLGLLAWLGWVAKQRRRFSGLRVSYGASKVVPGTPITWSLKGATQQLKSARCSLVYREASRVEDSRTFDSESSTAWTHRDRLSRPLTSGTFILGKSDPKPVASGERWGQWAIRVEDGPVTAYFPLPEMEG